MKYLILILVSANAWGAPVLQKDLGVFGNWRVAQIESHAFTGKNACLAWTQTSDGTSTLEVYAEEDNGVYVAPTVQVVIDPKTPQYIRGVMVDNKKLVELHLTLMSSPTAGFGLLARIDDRDRAIDAIKRAGTVDVRLGGERNKLVKTLKFSLKGSSKAVDALKAGCGL